MEILFPQSGMKLAKCPAALQRGIVNFKEFLYYSQIYDISLTGSMLYNFGV